MSVNSDSFLFGASPASDGANHDKPDELSGSATGVGLESRQGIMAAGTTFAPTTSLPLDLDWPDSLFFGTEIDGQDVFSPLPGSKPQDLNFTFPPANVDYANAAYPFPLPLEEPAPELKQPSGQEAMEDFFATNGAWRPPEPCSHCRRLCLQCLMLQTTDANPNPKNSCSSCVALFRNCSLAERSKRAPSKFETSRPVIGHLHGVNEENIQLTWDQATQSVPGLTYAAAPIPSVSSKRSCSRSFRKTQILRDWFTVNIEHPYPTNDEKTALTEQSGLSKTQVIDWFANARRRYRLSAQPLVNNATFRGGSPMPRSLLSSMTPFERWQHSPPDSEPVSEAAIQEAISSNANSHEAGLRGDMEDLGSSASTGSMLDSHSTWHHSSGGSLSNYSHSHTSANSDAALSRSSTSQDRAYPAWVKSPSAGPKRPKTRTYTCSYCSRRFNKKYDYFRHVHSVHAPGDTSWVCAIPLPPEQSCIVWRLGQTQAECIFCGQSSPTEEHFLSHEFESCAKRTVQDRSFSRKDHMWQHLYKFHGCRKWEGWEPDVNVLMHKSGGS